VKLHSVTTGAQANTSSRLRNCSSSGRIAG
jgi:hypothetical protein